MTYKDFRMFEVIGAYKGNRLGSATMDPDTDLFVTFRGFLILGRFLGIVPVSGVFKRSCENMSFRLKSMAGLTTCACIFLISFNMILAFMHSLRKQKRSASEIALAIPDLMFGFRGFFMYTYFLINREKIVDIFKLWKERCSRLGYSMPDNNFKRVIIILCVVVFTSAVLENVCIHLEYFVNLDHITGHKTKYGREVSHLEIYYRRAHYYWFIPLGYNPVLPLLAFINHKLILYTINYMDVMLALFARAIYGRFAILNKAAENIVRPEAQSENLEATHLDRESWNKLAKDHESLCDIMSAMNKFFSPVVFVSYTINVYYVCIMVFRAMHPKISNESIVHKIYYPWSFIHMIARTYMVTYFLSRINEEAHKTAEIIARCPLQYYSGYIARLDRRLNTGQELGWSGLNCFTITKSLMLSILNTVFVIEIVLMQGLPPYESKDGDGSQWQ